MTSTWGHIEVKVKIYGSIHNYNVSSVDWNNKCERAVSGFGSYGVHKVVPVMLHQITKYFMISAWGHREDKVKIYHSMHNYNVSTFEWNDECEWAVSGVGSYGVHKVYSWTKATVTRDHSPKCVLANNCINCTLNDAHTHEHIPQWDHIIFTRWTFASISYHFIHYKEVIYGN